MKKIVHIIGILCVIPIHYSHAYTFTRPLFVGSTGEDVLQLQKILNTNTVTQIAQTGIGSIGNETTFFGQKTKDSVIRFQNLYAKDILHPVGLSVGTGFVGQNTLTLLNSIQNENTSKNQNTEMNTILTQLTGTSTANTIPQFLVAKKIVQPGQTLFVGSQNILKNVDFFLDSNILSKKCRTDFTCELTIAKTTKPNTYVLQTSNPLWGGYTITVLDSSIKKPEINLKKINLKEDNLIKGKYFSKNIKIYTMFGVFSSETLNNSFILKFPPEYTQNATSTKGIMYIENEDGLTSDILNIQYEI